MPAWGNAIVRDGPKARNVLWRVALGPLAVIYPPPVQGGWGGLPLERLLTGPALRRSRKGGASKGGKKETRSPRPPLEIHREPRVELELVWAEKQPWTDPESGRRIRCRQI